MKRSLFYLAPLFLLVSCGSSESQEKSTTTAKEAAAPKTVKATEAPVKTVQEEPKTAVQPPKQEPKVTAVAAPEEVNESKEEKLETIHADEPHDGYALYAKKCSSCHGKDAKKSALNASAQIAGWQSQKIQDALQGYEDGSYGGKMKAMMKGQVSSLSKEERKVIADYISTL